MKQYTLLFLFFTCIVLFQNCTTNTSNYKVFRFNQVDGVESLDPAFAKNKNVMWHTNQLYNRLIEYDNDKIAKPSLAKSWTISPDKKTYTFILRNDVYFHDNECFANSKGRKLVAEDVAYSFNRIINKKTASPGSWIFNDKVDSIRAFVAINDTTFQLHLIQAFNPMMGILSMQYCSIVPHEVVEKWGADFRSHPCGTGPFMLEQWDEGTCITFIKNKNYWEKDSNGHTLPYIDGVKATCIDSRATEFLLFMQGKLDFLNEIDASFKDEVISKHGELKDAYNATIHFEKRPQLVLEYIGILVDTLKNKNIFLHEKKLRQAIAHAIDKQKLLTYFRNNIGVVANAGVLPIGIAGYDSTKVKGLEYNITLAKKLVQEVTTQLHQKPSITLLTPDNYADRCNFIASQLQDIGINAKVEIMQASLLREQMSKSQAEFFRASWIADYPDAESFMAMFYSKNIAPPNYTRFHNTQFDTYYEQALASTNEQEKIELYQRMDKIIIEEAAVIPIFYDQSMHFIQKNIKGFEANELNLISLKKVWW